MRNLLTKLFGISLLLSAVVPSMTRINPAWDIAVKVLKSKRKKLLAAVDNQVLIESSSKEYYITSLEAKLVQEVRNRLKELDIPDYEIKDVLILGKKDKKIDYCNQKKTVTETLFVCDGPFPIPYAILIDTECLAQSSPFDKQFLFLREGGHVKSHSLATSLCEEGRAELCRLCIFLRRQEYTESYRLCTHQYSNKKYNKVMAEIYALDALIRLRKKDDFKELAKNLYSQKWQAPCLTSQELVYNGKKLFDSQQKEEEVDVQTYTQKIITDRQKKGYGQKIRQEAKKLLGLTCDNRNDF